MTATSLLRALAGGALIGVAASIALVANGRIAGISGVLGRAFDADADDGRTFRIAFLIGLIATGAIVVALVPAAFGAPVRRLSVLAVGGGLVGVGTTLANGCTSGHGVCGVARGSPRSIAAVIAFMVTGALTVAVLGAHA